MAINVNTEDVSKRIKEIRTIKKISQEKMAELLGMTFSNYTRIENAYQNITVKHLRNISKILDVSADTLLFGEIDKANGLDFEDFIRLTKTFKEEDIEDFIIKLQSILKIIKIK